MRQVDEKAGGSQVVQQGGSGREVVTRQIAGETLIIPVAGHVGDLDAIYTLNDVGSRIWELIEGPTVVSRIVETLSREYDVSPDQATQDVLEFVGALESKGLIRSSVERGSEPKNGNA